MKNVKGLSLKLASLMSLIGVTTACGDMDVTKAQVKAPTEESVSRQLDKMGRLTKLHSTTPAMAGGICGGRPGIGT